MAGTSNVAWTRHGTRVVKRELEQRLGRQACSGEAQRDARRVRSRRSLSKWAMAPVSSFVTTLQERTLAQPDRIVRGIVPTDRASRANMIR